MPNKTQIFFWYFNLAKKKTKTQKKPQTKLLLLKHLARVFFLWVLVLELCP